MADRASASIIIGGTISRSVIPELIDAIGTDHGRADWEGEALDAEKIVEGVSLEICAYDLPGGIFEHVESFCLRHKLSYRRSSGSCSGIFGPERVVYDGHDQPRHYELNESDAVVLTLRELQDIGSYERAEIWFTGAEFTPPPILLSDSDARRQA
ncbi:hypothetical protein AWL63_18350 [Sphingomonas panacis]|uniref:Uncharacterized protein n=1 Tax=Sphingomonas panacis TaxID=1560345 RepID=A0A1B3ZDX7_9SPHN|nr:hypothetical protein [Sphingomonas panacis]AOH85605.1 hypothetical protein AWL63_18350 [Sphingomonas panacis]